MASSYLPAHVCSAKDVRFESTCQLPYSEKWSPRLRAVDYGIMAANVSGQVAFVTIAEFKELTNVGVGPNKLCCERAVYLVLALAKLYPSLCLTLIQLRQNGGELLEMWLKDPRVLSLAEAAASHLHIMDISLAFVLFSLQAGP